MTADTPASFFGIDLAWSAGNRSGTCALDAAGSVIDERMLSSDDAIVDWISERLDGPAVVAIDAPLWVPNEAGRRPCEDELARVYGSRKAGAHPSNRTRLLGVHGTIRGEVLAACLATLGFGDPWSGSKRTLLEVYPHPAIIEAFDLDERVVYKAKRGVSVADRRRGLGHLATLLAQLAEADPPLNGPPVAVDAELRGAALKQVEDRLDARVCAWVASVWGSNPARIRLFGDSETGHIAVPIGAVIGGSRPR